MAEPKVQTFENHTRIVPGFHVVTFALLVINAIWSIYRMATAFSMETLVGLLVAAALLLLFVYTRRFATTVQNRVIRLEMKLRLREVLPASLRPRIDELTVRQLIALRFASDAELPDLCSKVLADRIHDQKAIKRMVRNWQADHLRA
jgi:hypothetical protein